MNPNYPQSDDFQNRPRYVDEDERQYGAGQGRFWGEGQRGRGEEPYQSSSRRGQWSREDSWGREQPWSGREQSWSGREQPWGGRGEQPWGGREQHGERGRHQQEYQSGQRYRPYASEQYGQQYGGQQYGGQQFDQDRQQYGRDYDERYIGAYPSNASEAWRGEGGWRQQQRPWQQGAERYRQGGWEDPYAQRQDQYGQQPYGQQYGQHGQHGQQYGQGQGWGRGQQQGAQQDYGFRGRGPKGYSRSDERIKEDICERLSQDPRIDASEISVECRSGVVMLEGSVEDRATKHRVEDLVDSCSGVKDIQNHLGIAAGGRQESGEQQTGSAKTAAAAGSTKKQ